MRMNVRMVTAFGALALAGACQSPDQLEAEGAASENAHAPREEVTAKQGSLLLGDIHPDGPCHGGATQCDGIGHCCPAGEGMQAVYLDSNTFICRPVQGASPSGAGCYVDDLTQRTLGGITMKGCPVGYFMRGYNQNQNKTYCCPYGGSNAPTFWELDGIQGGPHYASPHFCSSVYMHSCRNHGLMEGIHAAGNHMICAY